MSTRRWFVNLAALTAVAGGLRGEPAYQTLMPPEEFAARRSQVFERIRDGVAVLQGAPEQPAELRFRQNNQFFYLTGVEVPRALLLLDGLTKRVLLFLTARTDRRDRMFGEQLAPGVDAARATGIEQVLDLEAFDAALKTALGAGRPLYVPFRPEVVGGGSAGDAVAHAAATTADPWDGRESRAARFLQKLRDAVPAAELRDLDPILDALRLRKSAREIAAISDATRMAADGIAEAMRDAAPGLREQELQAVAEYVFKKGGAQGPAYFALVATGPDTLYSHYHRGTRVLADGDLVQFDYAPDYAYYVSDVTRVFPANGRFSARQREWYGIYLRLYRAVMTSIQPHVPIKDIVTRAVARMDAEMASYPFIDPALKAAAVEFVDRYRQSRGLSLGHWVGMEVHDVGGLTSTLEPGELFTIEPAMTLPAEHLGIRLEDVILMTASGFENLSAAAPVEIEDIERVMREPGLSELRATRDGHRGGAQ